MATAYARWILSTQSRPTLKMQRFEPSIHLACAGGTVVGRVGPPLAASFRDLWRPLGVSLLSSLFSLLCALFSLCSLPSSLFSLCSLASSLAAGQFSDRTSHFSLRTLHQAIHPASNPLDPVPHHPWPGGMREAIK